MCHEYGCPRPEQMSQWAAAVVYAVCCIGSHNRALPESITLLYQRPLIVYGARFFAATISIEILLEPDCQAAALVYNILILLSINFELRHSASLSPLTPHFSYVQKGPATGFPHMKRNLDSHTGPFSFHILPLPEFSAKTDCGNRMRIYMYLYVKPFLFALDVLQYLVYQKRKFSG